jgi:isoprenylcysteine carboxyl methyltransferase (ICMT) family protein YpbQ
MDIAQLWAFLIIIPGASVIDRMLYKVTKNPYLAGIITGVIVAIISCANTTTRLI